MTISYDVPGAAAATGVSVDVIRNAIRAGHLEVRYPRGSKKGQPISKGVILADDLHAWVAGSPSERS